VACRNCDHELSDVFADLGAQPLSNSYLTKCRLNKLEKTYPLRVRVCPNCFLVQTEEYADRDDFFNSDYAYYSSTSSTWLSHASVYTEMIVDKLDLNKNSFVVELASNDGYLLKNFVQRKIPCLGVEPSRGTADAARQIGVPSLQKFFSHEVSQKIKEEYSGADLIIGNNVYAHVPDINDFTAGICELLKPSGVVTLEFPHLLNLLNSLQFDTIYHEHYSYLSLYTVNQIFEKNGLTIFDVEKLNTHGGSLRVFGARKEVNYKKTKNFDDVVQDELDAGINKIGTYLRFQNKIECIKDELLLKLIELKRNNKTVVGYGAAAKGNTLMNFAGIRSDLISFVSDKSVAKQCKYTPGSHLKILSPKQLIEAKPDYIVIFPWNLKNEIILDLKSLGVGNAKFIVAIPKLEVLS
jgi:SAM-dependent methyltransferase